MLQLLIEWNTTRSMADDEDDIVENASSEHEQNAIVATLI